MKLLSLLTLCALLGASASAATITVHNPSRVTLDGAEIGNVIEACQVRGIDRAALFSALVARWSALETGHTAALAAAQAATGAKAAECDELRTILRTFVTEADSVARGAERDPDALKRAVGEVAVRAATPDKERDIVRLTAEKVALEAEKQKLDTDAAAKAAAIEAKQREIDARASAEIAASAAPAR